MKGLSKDKSIIKIVVYVLPLCYIFNFIFEGLFAGASGHASSRAFLLILWLIAGYAISKKSKPVQPVVSALIFCIYTFFVYLYDAPLFSSNSLSILSCIFVWPLAFYNAMNISFNKTATQVVAILMGLTCNLMAFNWATGIKLGLATNPFAAMNSIYYVLIAFLYIFLIRKTLIMAALMAYPLATLISSGKTTCVLLSVSIVLYFSYQRFKNATKAQKFSIVLFLLAGIYWGLENFDLDQIFKSASTDFGSGGSGRLDIWSNAFDIISNFSIGTIVGYGYGATVEFLGIGAHNDFLETFIDFGIIGLTLYLIFIYHLIKSIGRFKYSPEYRIPYIISIIVFLTLSCVSKLVGTQVQFLLFTTFWGLLLSKTNQKKIYATN